MNIHFWITVSHLRTPFYLGMCDGCLGESMNHMLMDSMCDCNIITRISVRLLRSWCDCCRTNIIVLQWDLALSRLISAS